jgi:hypothetical protein
MITRTLVTRRLVDLASIEDVETVLFFKPLMPDTSRAGSGYTSDIATPNQEIISRYRLNKME